MIYLDFELHENTASCSDPHPDGWVSECQIGGFEGYQIIRIDDIDFSGELPLLHFARELKGLSLNLNSGDSPVYFNDLDSNWKITFELDGGQVLISDNARYGQGKGIVQLQKFTHAVQNYSERLFDACCDLFPPLLDNEYIMRWWTKPLLSYWDFEPNHTDRKLLHPNNPFFMK